MQDYWIAEMAVIVDGERISTEYFEGTFPVVRELIELAEDAFVAEFSYHVTFDLSLESINV